MRVQLSIWIQISRSPAPSSGCSHTASFQTSRGHIPAPSRAAARAPRGMWGCCMPGSRHRAQAPSQISALPELEVLAGLENAPQGASEASHGWRGWWNERRQGKGLSPGWRSPQHAGRIRRDGWIEATQQRKSHNAQPSAHGSLEVLGVNQLQPTGPIARLSQQLLSPSQRHQEG